MKPLRLVLPCYNEAPNLPGVVERALECARRRALGPRDFELILVDNASRDDSPRVMEELARGPLGAHLRIVRVARNRGYGHGVMTGLAAAGPGILAWSHADLQCDPEDAFRGWELIRDGAGDVLVKGRRHGRALGERVVSRGFELTAALLLGERHTEINAQPKVFPSELLAHLTDPPDDFAFDVYVLHRARQAGMRIREIDVRFGPRAHGVSNWSSTLRSRARTIGRITAYMARLRLAERAAGRQRP